MSKNFGGVYQYAVTVLKILSKSDLQHQFCILCNQPDDDIKSLVISDERFSLTRTQVKKYNRIDRLFNKGFNYISRIIGLDKRRRQKDLYDTIIEEKKIDIIHTPYQSFIAKGGVKSITTLHDVQELHFPEFFTSAKRAQRAVQYKKAIDQADAVIVSYDHVNRDIEKYFNKSNGQIHTVLLDMQELWFSKIANRNNEVLDKYHLPPDFLLYPAASWEHKNHLRLIEAIKVLNKPEVHLICTGNRTEYFTNEIEPFIKEQKLEEKVKFVGIVSDEELFELYHTCRAVVVPTLYEAGSFPLMESILMGIPVVCSNVTSLPETIGEKNFVFDPFNVDDIADKIDQIWFDDLHRKKNRALLKVQAEKLKNNNAAAKIDKIYKEIMIENNEF